MTTRVGAAGTDRSTRRPLLAPWAFDALLGAAVAMVLVTVISSGQGGRQQPDAVAYLWAIGLGSLMLARRTYPRTMLTITALGLFAYYAVGYPAVGVAVPVAAALFSAAEAGRLIWAIGTAVVVLGVSLTFRLVEGQDAAYVVGYELVSHVTLMAAAIALGDSIRSRRAQHAQQRELTLLAARQFAQDAERRVHEERLSIARDLHDSVGHTVAIVSLHSDVAREAIGRDDGAARAALFQIKRASSRTLGEIRSTVTLLRSPVDGPAQVTSLAGIHDVLKVARAAGLTAESDIDGAITDLPATVDAAAFRITQEAVTNVVRHAGATEVRVTAVIDDGVLHLTIADNGALARASSSTGTSTGTGTSTEPPAGHGIIGMTERARALGGRLTARAEGNGFAVRAELPVRVVE